MTGMNIDAYDRKCLEVIAEHGWMVQGVVPRYGEDGAPFAYTVGLTVAGLPELVIAGLPGELSAQLLNPAAQQSLTTELHVGQVLADIASVPLRVIDAPHAPVNLARHFYGDKVRSLQLVWPDAAGAFPDDETWSLGQTHQPIFNTASKEVKP